MSNRQLAALVMCAACDRTTAVDRARPPVPPPSAGELVQPGQMHGFEAPAGLAVIARAGADLAALERLAREHAGAAIAVRRTSLRELGVDDEYVQALHGAVRDDAAAIEASPGGILLSASGAGLAQLHALAAVASPVAAAAHGWVMDPGSGQLYRSDELASHVATMPPDLRQLISVHGVRGGNVAPYLDTIGMHRLGFAELYVPAAAPTQLEELTTVINATAQALVTRGDVSAPGELAVDLAAFDGSWGLDDVRKQGGTGRLTWRVRWAHDPEQPAGPLVVQLESPDGASVEALTKLLDRYFGPIADHTVQIPADDPEILASRVRARRELAALRSHFAKGVPAKESLEIKAPFRTTDGSVEWMWIDVAAIHGEVFDGTLDSEPQDVPALHVGAKVHAKLADVADYWHVRADGSTAGHLTLEIMKRRGAAPP